MSAGRFVVVLALLLVALSATADGGFFWREKIPPTIPYQRAIILTRGGQETLILQSKYEVPGKSAEQPLGWVVPVPAVPEVASLKDGSEIYRLFWRLGHRTGPDHIGIVNLLVVVAFVLYLLVMTGWFVGNHEWAPTFLQNLRGLNDSFFRIFGCVGLIVFLMAGMLLPTLGKPGAVDVISTSSAGVYQVQVVKAQDASDLMAWLKTNDFVFAEHQRPVIDAYLKRGWCFVVAKTDAANGEEGLMEPLVLRFPAAKPVYPLALTATGGYETEVLLYVFADHRLACGDRLPLRFAGRPSDTRLDAVLTPLAKLVVPPTFFKAGDLDYPYLSKFRGTLTPLQTQQDLILTLAPSDRSYRELDISW